MSEYPIMKKEEKIRMILRQLNGEASRDEKEIFSQWLLEGSKNLDLYIEIKGLWELPLSSGKMFNTTFEAERIHKSIHIQGRKHRILQNLMTTAAIAVIFIVVGSIFYLRENSDSHSVSATQQVNMVTKSSGAGEQLRLTLSDGTVVRMNAESSIQFPEKFETNCRSVKLTGEAFFEVTKDPKRPFTVHTDQISTTVLGTSFNIKAFKNEDIAVTVATGRVRVENSFNKTKEVFLHPNEQAVYNKQNSNVRIDEVDAQDYYTWTGGIIRFNDDSLEEVVKTLERWFDVTISLEGQPANYPRIKGSYKDNNLNSILDGLSFIYNLNYKLDGNKTIVITLKPS